MPTELYTTRVGVFLSLNFQMAIAGTVNKFWTVTGTRQVRNNEICTKILKRSNLN